MGNILASGIINLASVSATLPGQTMAQVIQHLDAPRHLLEVSIAPGSMINATLRIAVGGQHVDLDAAAVVSGAIIQLASQAVDCPHVSFNVLAIESDSVSCNLKYTIAARHSW